MGAGLRDIGPKEVLSAPITKAWSGSTADHNLVAAQGAGKKVVVVGFFFTSDAAETLTIYNGASTETNPLTGGMTVTGGGWIKGNYNPDGHFQTSENKALVIKPSGNVTIGGWINYYVE